jgi:hypothetical protein
MHILCRFPGRDPTQIDALEGTFSFKGVDISISSRSMIIVSLFPYRSLNGTFQVLS